MYEGVLDYEQVEIVLRHPSVTRRGKLAGRQSSDCRRPAHGTKRQDPEIRRRQSSISPRPGRSCGPLGRSAADGGPIWEIRLPGARGLGPDGDEIEVIEAAASTSKTIRGSGRTYSQPSLHPCSGVCRYPISELDRSIWTLVPMLLVSASNPNYVDARIAEGFQAGIVGLRRRPSAA